jgi:hypothetical protein
MEYPGASADARPAGEYNGNWWGMKARFWHELASSRVAVLCFPPQFSSPCRNGVIASPSTRMGPSLHDGQRSQGEQIMKTLSSDLTSMKQRMFRVLCLLVVLTCLLPVVPAANARPVTPAQNNLAVPGAQPLDEFLNPDGTLNLPAGRAISLDPQGYQLVSGQGEAPRFVLAGPDDVPGDENWASGLFPWPGTSGPVYALAVDAAGNLYAGGDFTAAGGVSANRIAIWDGNAWSALGSGMNDPVNALAVDAAGNLYAGGRFTTAGGASANHIATWDGSAWSALGSGMDGPVYALAVDGAGNLYAGGGFTTAGTHASAQVARWTAADGERVVATGSYVFDNNNLPVSIRVTTLGTLNRLALQRFNRSHPQATPSLNTGYYWGIVGTDANGNPASGYVVDLTLPATFTADSYDQVCRFTGTVWNCAANAHAPDSITRTRITHLSDWTVGDYPAPDPFEPGTRYLPLVPRRH